MDIGISSKETSDAIIDAGNKNILNINRKQSEIVDVESDEYYNEIDKRMKDNFPHRFASQEQRRPVQKVASAGRSQQGRRSVRLTKSQVAIAKKLGVPLEEYAKFVKEV